MIPVPDLPYEIQARALSIRNLCAEDLHDGDYFDTQEAPINDWSLSMAASLWNSQHLRLERKSLAGGLTTINLNVVVFSYWLYDTLDLFDWSAILSASLENVRVAAPYCTGDRIRLRAVVENARRSIRLGRSHVRLKLKSFNSRAEQVAFMRLDMLLSK